MKALRILFLTAVVLAALYGRATAQVCGDADASGAVTVTDGVQVLRAAAGLSSTCAANAASCDVDGSGTATVSDGVNVLRKAAGLSITENCPTGGGTGDVPQVTDALVPFLALGLKEVPNVSIGSASAVHAAATENCEDGGSRETTQQGVTVTVHFNACRVSQAGLGSFQFDGEIVVNLGFPNSSVQFELNITDLSNSRLIDFDGTIQGTPRVGGGFVVNGGPIVVRNTEGGPEVFRLTFNALTVDGDGKLVSGSVEAEDTSDSFDLDTAELEVESSSTATVHVVRDDSSTQDFTLNLNTGDLTPVS
jgi:hypothetical protein